jgi:hypothetical protein
MNYVVLSRQWWEVRELRFSLVSGGSCEAPCCLTPYRVPYVAFEVSIGLLSSVRLSSSGTTLALRLIWPSAFPVEASGEQRRGW